MSANLHYIFDPLCGWCYAASPLVRQATEQFGDKLSLIFHPGLLFATPRVIEPSYRSHIINADQRIGAMAGVEFGAAYVERIRSAPRLSYDSRLPSAAVLAAAEQDAGLRMLQSIQHLHYVLGEDAGDPISLSRLAVQLGLNLNVYGDAVERIKPTLPALAEIAHELMYEAEGTGFPTFLLEIGGQRSVLEHSDAYGKPEVFVARIDGYLSES